jgi:inner membrane protein
MLPDADVIGFRFGIAYGDPLGHRGFTHSLLFATVVSAVAIAPFWKKIKVSERVRILICIFAATASHGILDAFTDGGMGVAFFAPFTDTRYFFPVTPIKVSPLTASAFLTQYGLSVIASEVACVWIPCVVAIVISRLARCPKNR